MARTLRGRSGRIIFIVFLQKAARNNLRPLAATPFPRSAGSCNFNLVTGLDDAVDKLISQKLNILEVRLHRTLDC